MTYEDIIKSLQEQISNLSLQLAISQARIKELEKKDIDIERKDVETGE